jgi:hypothetical protein
MLQGLPWFLEQAHADQSGIWLAIPSGMLTGFPLTLSEYTSGLVEIGTLRPSSNKENAEPDYTVSQAAEAGLAYLASATLFVGNQVHNLGYAVVDPGQVSAFGWFENITIDSE